MRTDQQPRKRVMDILIRIGKLLRLISPSLLFFPGMELEREGSEGTFSIVVRFKFWSPARQVNCISLLHNFKYTICGEEHFFLY